MMPLRGVLHSCLLCDPPMELCEACFLHPQDAPHLKHPFVRRAAPGSLPEPALRTVHDTQVQLERFRQGHEQQRRRALAAALADRELGPEDYELLQQLDRPAAAPPEPAVIAAETDESLRDFLLRVVCEHEVSKLEW